MSKSEPEEAGREGNIFSFFRKTRKYGILCHKVRTANSSVSWQLNKWWERSKKFINCLILLWISQSPVVLGIHIILKFTALCLFSHSVSAFAGSGLASLYLPDPDLCSAELPSLWATWMWVSEHPYWDSPLASEIQAMAVGPKLDAIFRKHCKMVWNGKARLPIFW